MKVNLNIPLRGLDGNVIEESPAKPVIIGNVIANFLIVKSSGIEPILAYDWALILHHGETLDLNAIDAERLCEFIKNHEQATNLLKAQAINAIKGSK